MCNVNIFANSSIIFDKNISLQKCKKKNLTPGEDGIVSADGHEGEHGGEGEDHAAPVRVAHQLHPRVARVEQHRHRRHVTRTILGVNIFYTIKYFAYRMLLATATISTQNSSAAIISCAVLVMNLQCRLIDRKISRYL